MSEYTEQAEKFLKDSGLEFRAVLVGSDCPTFCPDAEKEIDMDKVDSYPRNTHIHGKHYRCTISAKGRGHVAFDFWNSYSDEEFNFVRLHPHDMSYTTLDRVLGKRGYSDGAFGVLPRLKTKPRTPSAYDLLACLQKNDPGTFHDFCGYFEYDEDSRKAETVYHAVVKEWQKVERFFTSEELNSIQEIS